MPRWVIGIFLALVCFLVAALVLKGIGLLSPGSGRSTQTGSDVLVTSESAISKTGEVTLFNRSTDRQIWQKQMPVNDITPVSANGLVFVVTENPWGSSPVRTDTLEALSLASGQQIWSSKLAQQFGGLSVIVSQGQVYAYSPWDYTPDTLVVFQAGNGQQEWAYPTTGWIYHVVTDVG